jgi:hypothetical protein
MGRFVLSGRDNAFAALDRDRRPPRSLVAYTWSSGASCSVVTR